MKRASGVLMHLSTLWGEYSEGSMGAAAREWIDFLSECGFSYWQTLPFCLPDECNSPYKSYSAFSVNPFFIDLEELYAQGLISAEELDSARQLSPYACEFTRLGSERLNLLDKAAKRFDGPEKISAFLNAHENMRTFCRFMALKKSNGGKPWNEWTNDVPNEDEERLWEFICYEFLREWQNIRNYAAEKGISVIGDIPIYVSYDSADVWSNPSLFKLDKDRKMTEVAGVPPDYFSEEGQKWGNPLYDWAVMEKDGFSWWRERISFMTELFDGVRIDHFRAIESYFSIPADAQTAKNGKWIKGPGMKFIGAIKEAAAGAMLIAEDLGDITPEVQKLVENSGFPGMRVLQFAFLGDKNSPHLPHNYGANCIAYTGTHDNNTLLGYVWESSQADRQRMLSYFGFKGENWDSCYDDILRSMLASAAPLVIFPAQDLLLYGSDTRFNTPGKADGNWSYRLTREQLGNIDKEKFRAWNDLYARD